MSVLAYPPAPRYARLTAVRLGLVAAVLLGVAAGGGVLLLDQPSASVPFIAMVAATGLLVALTVFRWPVAGLYAVLFGVVLLEPFPVAGDPTSTYTWIFHANLSSWTPLRFPMSPLELLLILTALAWLIHAGNRGRVGLPLGTLGPVVLALGGFILAGYLYGVGLNGGDSRIALWELRAPTYVVAGYFLTGALFRSTRQITVVNWLITVGLILNGLRASWRYFAVGGLTEGNQSISGFAHENALLLAMMIVLCLAQLTFGRQNALRWTLLLGSAPVAFALLVSQRRAGFAALVVGVIVWAVVLFLKRRKLFWAVIPALLVVGILYTAAFWNRTEGILGQPVRAVQTVLGVGERSARDQSSDYYRQLEEYNLWRTIRDNPVAGIGFGRPFTQYIPMVILDWWEFQFYTPHNQIFWVWLKLGVGGFVVTLWLFGLGVAGAARLLHEPLDAAVMPFVVMTAAYIVMLTTFAYVDIGLANGRPMMLLGVLLGLTGNLPALLGQAAAVARPAVAPSLAAGAPTTELAR